MAAPKDQEKELMKKHLAQLLTSIESSGRSILPDTNQELLETIVEAAGKIFHAAAASILLINEQEQMLEFKVAYGVSTQDLIGRKFPLNQGIAGSVVMTGQPLSISNVRQDARFNQDFAKSTGYIPNSILAMPLKTGGRIVGVMEVLDKINATSFGMQDIELLGIFAHQAAIAIDQSQTMNNLQKAFLLGLRRLVDEQKIEGIDTKSELTSISRPKNAEDLLELADLFSKIGKLGDAERNVCIRILQTFSEYQQSTRKVRHVR